MSLADARLSPIFLVPCLLALSACDTSQPVVCGDGIVDSLEQCDDGNKADGDGCTSACDAEIVAPVCTILASSTDFSELLSVLVTDDGHAVVVGRTEGADSVWRNWVASFDSEGHQQWKLDFEGPLSAVRPVEGNDAFGKYAFIHRNNETRTFDVVGLFEGGTTNTLRGLPQDDPEFGSPRDLVDTDNGLLLGGSRQADLWLAKLGDDGSLTTLVSRDSVGLRDEFVELRRNGSTIMALAVVGATNHSDDDELEMGTRDTWLIEYDQQGNELSNTVLSGGDDKITLTGNTINVGPDGTWYVAGVKTSVGGGGDLGVLGWGAAVRDGKVLWTFESPGSIEPKGTPLASFHGLVIGEEHVLLAGKVGSTTGVGRWVMRLDAKAGDVVAELIGEPVLGEADGYSDADGPVDGRAWLVGNTHTSAGSEQWLCTMQN